MLNNLKQKKGFLVLEAVLSILIISTVLIMLVDSLSALLRFAYFNQDILQAVNLLEEKFSELRLQNITNLSETQGNFSLAPDFNWQYEVSELEEENISLSNLTVSVNWTKHGRKGNIYLNSFIKQ